MKVSFYLMNPKGLHVLERFINKFGAAAIEYVVSAIDLGLKDDSFHQIKSLATEYKIKFFERSKFPVELEKSFNSYKFAIGWRWLIQNEYKLIVFHDSLLPKYRGFAPLVNSLINKEPRGGVTALLADVKYDCGDILVQKSIDFNYPIKIQQAIKLIEPLYFDLVSDIYSKLADSKEIEAKKQNDENATYSPWLDEEDYYIDWGWCATKIRRFVDSVSYPYAGAKTTLNNEVYIFEDVEELDDVDVENRERHLGKVIFMQEGAPVVICKRGLLKIKTITNTLGEQAQINFRSRFK